MKPDWKDAPEWAMWLAMDEDGQWVWYELEPRLHHSFDGRAIWFVIAGSWKQASASLYPAVPPLREPRP